MQQHGWNRRLSHQMRSDRERPLSYDVMYMQNLKKKKKRYNWTYLQNRNRLTDLEKELTITGEKGEGGRDRLGVWIDIDTLLYFKLNAFPWEKRKKTIWLVLFDSSILQSVLIDSSILDSWKMSWGERIQWTLGLWTFNVFKHYSRNNTLKHLSVLKEKKRKKPD